MAAARRPRKFLTGVGASDFDMAELTEATNEQFEQWMGENRDRLVEGSSAAVDAEKIGRNEEEEERGDKKAPNNNVPFEMRLESTEYEQPTLGIDGNLVRYVMSNIDEMSTTEMKKIARTMLVSVGGTKKQLRSRLRAVFRKEWASIRMKEDQLRDRFNKTSLYYDYLVVVDIECTCVEILRQYPHEIIEMPAVLVDVASKTIVDTFQTFVRPVLNPKLDRFCVDFTSITQEQVDNAPYFPEALLRLREWMNGHQLGMRADKRYAFVTDGPCDFAKFMQFQCLILGMKLPHIFRHFINIKKIFENKVERLEDKGKRAADGKRITSLQRMLNHYNIPFEGRSHSGLDDAKNIARLTIRMMQEGIDLKVNQRIVKKGNFVDPSLENRIRKAIDDGDLDNLDRALWDRRLIYRTLFVSQREFFTEGYKECDTCDERKKTQGSDSSDDDDDEGDCDSEEAITRKRERKERRDRALQQTVIERSGKLPDELLLDKKTCLYDEELLDSLCQDVDLCATDLTDAIQMIQENALRLRRQDPERCKDWDLLQVLLRDRVLGRALQRKGYKVLDRHLNSLGENCEIRGTENEIVLYTAAFTDPGWRGVFERLLREEEGQGSGHEAVHLKRHVFRQASPLPPQYANCKTASSPDGTRINEGC